MNIVYSRAKCRKEVLNMTRMEVLFSASVKSLVVKHCTKLLGVSEKGKKRDSAE